MQKLWDILGKIMGYNGKNYGIYYGIFCQKLCDLFDENEGHNG